MEEPLSLQPPGLKKKCFALMQGRANGQERRMNLTDEQKAMVRGWAAEGDSLGAIQKKLQESCGLQLTYMDTRMLVADLEVSLRDKETAPAKQASPESAVPVENDAAATAKKPGAGVTVALDSIAQPNALVSGSVQFSDGERAYWAIDGMGRLALDPDTPGYRPKEQDVLAFQTQLRQAVQRAGY